MLFASDLDRTLIYSANSMLLAGPDDAAPPMVVAEVYRGAPLSFMTRSAEAMLEDLAQRGQFVPVTTRTREQFERIRLPGRGRGYAISTNGAVLMKDGVPDAAWTASIRSRISRECVPLAEVFEQLTVENPVQGLVRARTAEDTFIYCLVERASLSPEYLADLTDWCGQRGWKVSLQGRKLYCVPVPVSKEAAVAEVRERMGVDTLITAGDSLLDAGMLEVADIAFRPAHGELHATGFERPHLTVTGARGILAGEEMVRSALEYARGSSRVAGHPGSRQG
ncbi:HAD family hydrolase [Arthrobacter pityocampae]|uniref:HAD family hydrolase n=1 Tax=Arthrobacter pityocampae TaxID=547334 RepID=A0A2S5IU71_9MICC|nr:HAD family hydrolase [Arthrobacter pityocampae]